MPCSDNGFNEMCRAMEAKEKKDNALNDKYIINRPNLKEFNNYIEYLETRNTYLAQILCFTLNNLHADAVIRLCTENKDLSDWWINHKKWDERKIK